VDLTAAPGSLNDGCMPLVGLLDLTAAPGSLNDGCMPLVGLLALVSVKEIIDYLSNLSTY